MKKNLQNRTVSLKDIAEKAGVSVPTVSRVLRDKGEISEDVRERIKKIASDLNWRRNLLVQGFQTGRTHLVGVMVHIAHYFYDQIFSGIHDSLVRHNYAPIVLWPAPNGEQPDEKEQLNRLLEYRVDGILMTPTMMLKDDSYLKNAWEQGVPVVCMDSHMPKTHADYVGHDTAAGGKIAAEYFLTKGHRNFAHFAGPQHSISVSQRGKGFEKAIAEAGCKCFTQIDNSFGNNIENAVDFLKKLDGVTAIFSDNDYQAEKIYQAAAQLGLKIPEDISIIGFADIPLAEKLPPPLTTIKQDGYELGATAANHLISKINGKSNQLEAENIILPVELIERKSVTKINE